MNRQHLHKVAPILLILLVAVALRTFQLTAVPPGLTHDEANHGREAIGVLDGILLFYFPLNYGSEPIYSYTVAGSMALFGENLFALRLVNVIFGIAAIGITYLWAARAFGRKVALTAAALMAVSFWPLASSREALRAGMMPLFMGGAVYFYWLLFTEMFTETAVSPTAPSTKNKKIWLTIGFGLCVAITLHIYLASRVAWLLFPIFVGYLFVAHRPQAKKMAAPTVAGLVMAGLLVTPMFLYLRAHPEALTRLDMLDGPLDALRQGNLGPIFHNAWQAFLAFFWPGAGDQFLAYNIPGRPVFDGITAVFFLLGLGFSLWHWRKPAYALLLIWFATGIIPSLITGPTANTTRNLAAISAVHILPAVGFWQITAWAQRRWPRFNQKRAAAAAVLWLAAVLILVSRDYFVRWAQSPDVRGAYQTTLIAMLNHLQSQPTSEQPTLISTVYPGPAHDPSIALVLAPSLDLHWVDARHALLFPQGQGTRAVIPQSTPPHAVFQPWLTAQETVSLRPTDLDPYFTVYELAAPDWDAAQNQQVTFGDAVTLLAAAWQEPVRRAGETAVMVTMWRVDDPTKAGPVVPPAFTTDAVLFTQVLTADGQVLTQQDALDAPSWGWQQGDLFVQVHELVVPETAVPGSYQTIIGIYDRTSGTRLPVTAHQSEAGDTYAIVQPLEIGD